MSFDAAKPFHEGREKWSEERISELKRLHFLGYSASQIAKHLGGATRNAVIGKINRLGLLRYKRINKSPLQIKNRIDGRTSRKTRRNAIRLKPKPVIAALPVMDASPGALCIALLDLKPGMCRWPVGDGPVQLFCGHAQCDENSSYCKDHHIKAHVPYVSKRKKIRAPRENWDGDWHPFGMSMQRAA